jgi:ABC-type branched-subunit amino acid transport system substrate-binding protein
LVPDASSSPGDNQERPDEFERAFTKIGGKVVRRMLNPGAAPASVLDPLSSGSGPPTLVFFGGFTDCGAPELRRAMVTAGHRDLPLLSWDGIYAGSSADKGSYIQRAGEAAVGTYSSQPTIGPIRAVIEQRFRAAYGEAPDDYSAAAYACNRSHPASDARGREDRLEPAELRDAIREYAADPANRFRTVLGTIGFDANGDSLQQIVTLHRVGATVAGTALDWLIDKQQDFGPAP